MDIVFSQDWEEFTFRFVLEANGEAGEDGEAKTVLSVVSM